MNTVYLTDCMDFMADKPDNYYPLAIVDPPYGIGESGGKDRRQKSRHIKKTWDKERPGRTYFKELFRITKDQIVWGANYFVDYLYPIMGWICWDKKLDKSDFSDFELAWSSYKRAAKIFRYSKNGGSRKPAALADIIHPCQKPIALYKWLLKNYAKPGQTIFDSHVGSGSIRIACHDLGFDFEGCEIDADYWQAQEDRYNNHIQQGGLFGKAEIQDLIYC